MLNFFLTKKVVVKFILFYSFFINYLLQKGFCAPSVSLSTAEAEYISAVHAAKSVSWLRTLLRELHLISDDPIDLRIDNQTLGARCPGNQWEHLG